MRLAEFMTEALCNPEYGYYNNKVPIGRKGDFVTAPELHPIFAQTLTEQLLSLIHI